MSYKVDLLDRTTLTKLKEIEIVNEPTINEEINGSFTFDFEAHYAAKNDLTNNVLISVDGKYFKIAKVVKSRDDSITLSIHCEHVSYELIVDFELTDEMEYESDAQTMISEFLTGTRFTLVSCMTTDVKYYKTKTLDIRKRLFEVANLFGGELVFDNFNISLVHQRGADKGLDIELGVNLLGVTEEKDFVEGKTAYELDLLDLSQVNGYEMDFSSAELGDTITIKDNVLGIDTNERIIAIQYNPFKKALPTVTVGDYIRDLTEYFKDEDEEDEEKDDIKSLFKQFKIGGIDVLRSSTDATNDVLNYLTNKYELGIEVSAKYNTLKSELTGIVAEAANNNRILSVVQTKANESGLLVTTITQITSPTQLSSVTINDLENITLVLSDRPLSYYKEHPEEAEKAPIQAIGVCVTFNDNDSVFLEKFSVGKLSLLGTENGDVTELIEQFVSNQSVSPVATAEIEIDEFLKGLDVVPAEDYLKWHLTLIHSVEGENEGDWSHTIHDLPIADYANFKVTTNKKDSVIVVVSNEPFATILDSTATEDLYYRAFGGTFIFGEAPPEETDIYDYMSEFRIGDVDMLPIASDETEQVKSYVNGDAQYVIANAVYETTEDLIGLFAQLQSGYSGYHFTLLDYYQYRGNEQMYTDTWLVNQQEHGADEWVIPDNTVKSSFTFVISDIPFADITTANIDDTFIKAFGVTLKPKPPTPPGDLSGTHYGVVRYDSAVQLADNRFVSSSWKTVEFITADGDFLTVLEDILKNNSNWNSGGYGNISPLRYTGEVKDCPSLFSYEYISGSQLQIVQVVDGVITGTIVNFAQPPS